MKNFKVHEYTFDDLISSEEIDKLVRIFRNLTQIPIGIARTGSTMVGKNFCDDSEFSPICKLIRSTKEGNAACRQTDKGRANQVLNQEHGIHYLCHAGLVDFMVPVVIEHRHIATFNGGQLLPKPPSEDGFKKMLSNAKLLGIGEGELRKAYFNAPYASHKKIIAILELIEFFGNYFAEMGRRLRKTQENQKCHDIYYATEFIKANFRYPIGLHDVATHVGFSDSYFSRLFSKVTGDTFTTYLQKIRIGEAKKLLKKTDWSITTIAFDVGLGSIHYFNELFRKFECCCPSEFRKQTQKTRL